MQRDLLKARLSKLPHLPPLADPDRQLDSPAADEDDKQEALEADEEEDSFGALPALGTKTPRKRQMGKDYSPLSAAGYFAQALEVGVPIRSVYRRAEAEAGDEAVDPSGSSGTARVRVYYSPPPPPSSSSSLPADDDDDEEAGGNGTVFVCVHGAGYSGLSWACMAKELVEQSQPEEGGEEGGKRIGVLAYDARGHGKTTLPPPSTADGEGDTVDLSLQAQSDDLVALLKAVYPEREKAPAVVLVGHSMGGAVVADACNRIQREVCAVTGVVVVDVVEGTALEALSGMSALIAAHPKTFSSQEDAIAWHVQSRTINNLASARISVPPLIKPIPRADSVGGGEGGKGGEEEYGWRVDLAKTQPYWRGWFTSLSTKFLSCRTAKLLLLAGTDRLDKELLIGQMQGKYQLEVDPHVGHCVHEDAPARTASTLLSFLERNDRVDVLKGVKKLGGPSGAGVGGVGLAGPAVMPPPIL
ncbi:hypothetical protein JCM8097_005643 [Rhodosporidiobolus ruineniae]